MVSFSNLLASMFRCWEHAMLQIHIIFFALSSRVKSGLLVESPYEFSSSRLKAHTSFPLSFSNTVLHSHRFLYQTKSPPTSLYSFTQATSMIICALLCLNRYSLFAKTWHPEARSSMISSLSWHTLQLLSWTNPLAAFQDLVSTIFSNIIMIEDVFLPGKFWLNQRWHSSPCS